MSKSINIGPYRCEYPILIDPKPLKKDGPVKYHIKILIPKSDKAGYAKILNFVNEAVEETSWSANVKKQVKTIAKKAELETGKNDNCVLKDGDIINQYRLDEDKTELTHYANHWIVGLNRPVSFGPAMIVDQNNEKIEDEKLATTIMRGYWINVNVWAYCFEQPKKGVTLQFNAIQLVKKDDVFGQSSPFEVIEGSEVEDEVENDENPFE